MRKTVLLAAALLAAFTLNHAIAEEETAEAVDPKYTWDLTELFPSVEAWDQAREEVLAELGKRVAHSGGIVIKTNDDIFECGCWAPGPLRVDL